MRRLTVVIVDTFLMLNSFRVVQHSTDALECLQVCGQHYPPGIHWLEFHNEPGDPPHGARL